MTRPAAVPSFDPLVPTVFHQHWWLDAASNGQYDEVNVMSGDRVVGRFPYILRRIDRFRTVCQMPELTHFLGPAVDDGNGAACNRAVKRNEITRALLEQMPVSSGFWHKMHLGVSDMLAFQERAYRVTVEFTYEVAPAPEAVLWSNMRDKTRNVIRRASEKFRVSEITDPAEFIWVYKTNLARAGSRNIYTDATINRVCREARRRDQGRIWAARDATGAVIAAIFCIWDSRVAYYLMSTRSPDAGNGAVSLLIWHALLACTSRGVMFDFDGVGKPTNAHFFNGFGGRIVPRYIASRYALTHTAMDRMGERIETLARWPRNSDLWRQDRG